MWQHFFCNWIGIHDYGEPYSFPNEFLETETVLLVQCKRCGTIARIT